jgi:hypothetical protein
MYRRVQRLYFATLRGGSGGPEEPPVGSTSYTQPRETRDSNGHALPTRREAAKVVRRISDGYRSPVRCRT